MKTAPLEYLAHAAGPASLPTQRLEWALIALVSAVMIVVAALLVAALMRRRGSGRPDAIGAEATHQLVFEREVELLLPRIEHVVRRLARAAVGREHADVARRDRELLGLLLLATGAAPPPESAGLGALLVGWRC